ncbi:MAG: hypothetical protein U0163_22145 [Gemmatimonadaceae bacterium]
MFRRSTPVTRLFVTAMGIASVAVQVGTARIVPRASVRARPQRHSVSTTIRGRRFVIPFDSVVDAFAIDDARVLAASTRGDTAFVLLALSGPSRSPDAAMHYCGSGTEEYTVVATFPRAGRSAASFTRSASCFHNIESDEWKAADDSVVGGWWSYTPNQVHVRAVWLPKAPERGLMVAEVP